MNTTLTTNNLSELGNAANRFAQDSVFADYQSRKATNTLKRQEDDLTCFASFLESVGAKDVGNMFIEPAAWKGITWGLVDAFGRWLLNEGYAVSTVNFRLNTVKVYASLSSRSGIIPPDELSMIKNVRPFSHRESIRINEKRKEAYIDTRRGNKKPTPTPISIEDADNLKNTDDTPIGIRDHLIISLFVDLGLRVGELFSLEIPSFDFTAKTLTFWREKVSFSQTHSLSDDIINSVEEWLPLCNGILWNTFTKGGKLRDKKISRRAIFEVVRVQGARNDIFGLSPHDLRHAWATFVAKNGTPIDRLMQAGGWASYAMPLRYIESLKTANEGVILNTKK